ncbi:ligand-effect modulator 3 family [Linnemannia elongata]|nr:ligand-effect modulator 3 family [Linnemannia elongata]
MMDEPPKNRPPNTSFKQQRLKAWQPILTAKSVLPTFFILGILFAPLGGLLLWRNGQVTEMSFEYTDCTDALTWTEVPDVNFVHSSVVGLTKPTYMISNASQTVDPAPGSPAEPYVYGVQRCTVNLTIPADFPPPVMMYYKLTNFFQNHRKYTKSLDYKQLNGVPASVAELNSRKGCNITSEVPIYPCGLIANSMFNDTIYGLTARDSTPPVTDYIFKANKIASPADKGKYAKYGYPDLSAIDPPPNWRRRYPNEKYSAAFPPPDISTDEHFQVWMRTAGWSTFLKTYGRGTEVLPAGNYQLLIDMNFPIKTYGGKKYIVISSVGAIGGRNSFLGIGYIVVAVICAGLGVIFTAFHIARPRIIGDHSKISFGGEATVHTRAPNRADDAGGNRIRSRYEDD